MSIQLNIIQQKKLRAGNRIALCGLVVHSHEYGQWELMAWSGNNGFCALKTYWGNGLSLSIRKTSSGGLKMVIYDPNFNPEHPSTTMNVWFDGNWFGSASAITYSNTPTQVFLQIGHNWRVMEAFPAGHIMVVGYDSTVWTLGLSGTRYLGNFLDECVKEYGF